MSKADPIVTRKLLGWQSNLLSREHVTPLGVLGLLLLATVLQFNPAATGPEVGIWIGLSVVLFLPGFLLLRILCLASDRRTLGIAELPAAVVMSLAVWAIPAALVRFMHSSWQLFELTFTLGLWGLGLAYFYLLARRGLSAPQSESNTSLLVGAGLAGLGILVAWLVYWGPRDPDDWAYLSVVQQLISHQVFSPLNGWELQFFNLRFTVQVWVFVQAFVARWFGFDAVTLARDLLPTLLAPLSLVAFYALARELLGKSWLALLAVCFQVAIYLSFVTREGWGNGFFARVAQDKFLAWQLIIPIILLFFWRFMWSGARSDLLSYGLALLAGIFVHPISLALVFVVVGGFGVFNLLSRNPFPRTRWLLTTAWMIPAIVVALGFRVIAPSYLFTVDAPQVERYLHLSKGRLVIAPPLYLAHPNLVAHPLILIGLGILPIIATRLKRDRLAQFLWGGTLIPLALIFNPLTAWLLGQAIMPWEIWRVTWVLPTSIALAHVLTRGSSYHPRVRLAFIGAVAVAGLLLGTLDLNGSRRALEQSHALKPQVEELMRALPNYLDRSEVVLMPRQLTRLAPSFAANAQMTTGNVRLRNRPGRDLDRFYASDELTPSMAELLNSRGVKFVVLPTDTKLDDQFRRLPQFFLERHRNPSFALYEVIAPPVPVK